LESGNATTSSDAASNHERAPPTKARRKVIPSKSVQSKKSSGSHVNSSSSVRSSATSSTNDSNNKNKQGGTASQDNTAYSLPEPPPIYSSSSPSPLTLNKPTVDMSFPPPPPPMNLNSNDRLPKFQPYTATEPVDDSDGDDSGVEISFQPEDDVSTLGCSIMTSTKEPDGYKSDDIYSPPVIPDGSSSALARPKSSKKSRKNWRQQASSRRENRLALAPVDEQSFDTEPPSAPKTTSPTNPNPKQTIEEIMNRGVEAKPTIKSKSTKKKASSFQSEDEARVRRIAKSFSQAAGDGANSDSSNNDGGPPTVELTRENDEAVNRALKSKSFYSEDLTMGDSGIHSA